MKNKQKRVPTQIHTRKLDRLVAKNQMHKAGLIRICDKRTGRSTFAEQWRKFTIYDLNILA